MKKLLCVICLLAAVLFVNTADACATGRCGGSYYGRSSYSRSYSSHRTGYARHSSYGRYGRGYSHYGRGYGRHYGYRSYGRGYSRCTSCGYRR